MGGRRGGAVDKVVGVGDGVKRHEFTFVGL